MAQCVQGAVTSAFQCSCFKPTALPADKLLVVQALVLLDFLLLRGSEQSVQITQEELMYKLEDLETFAFTSPEGKDQGINVRHR